MKELAALAYRGNSPENRDYWKTQLMACISEIEDMYNEKMDDAKKDMENSYNLKVFEFIAIVRCHFINVRFTSRNHV